VKAVRHLAGRHFPQEVDVRLHPFSPFVKAAYWAMSDLRAVEAVTTPPVGFVPVRVLIVVMVPAQAHAPTIIALAAQAGI
jgi:hypothetical protein